MTIGFWWTGITFGYSGLASGGQEVNIEIFAMFAIGGGFQTAKALLRPARKPRLLRYVQIFSGNIFLISCPYNSPLRGVLWPMILIPSVFLSISSTKGTNHPLPNMVFPSFS